MVNQILLYDNPNYCASRVAFKRGKRKKGTVVSLWREILRNRSQERSLNPLHICVKHGPSGVELSTLFTKISEVG